MVRIISARCYYLMNAFPLFSKWLHFRWNLIQRFQLEHVAKMVVYLAASVTLILWKSISGAGGLLVYILLVQCKRVLWMENVWESEIRCIANKCEQIKPDVYYFSMWLLPNLSVLVWYFQVWKCKEPAENVMNLTFPSCNHPSLYVRNAQKISQTLEIITCKIHFAEKINIARALAILAKTFIW